MATLRAAAPLLLLIGCSLFAPSPALLPPAQPRNWFIRPPASVPASPKRSTVFITATRVLTEVHLSSCIVPTDPLPACPSDDEPSDTGTPPFRLESVSSTRSASAGRLSTDYRYRGSSAERHQLDPREDGSRRTGGRTFSGLQSMFMQMLHPASAPTPPLLRSPHTPAAAAAADGPITRTVYVTRRTGSDVPTTTSTVSFTLSGCVPSRMPFPLEPCDKGLLKQEDRPAQLRVKPTAVAEAAPAPATAAVPEALTAPETADEEMMLNGPGSEFLGALEGSEDSGSGSHGE